MIFLNDEVNTLIKFEICLHEPKKYIQLTIADMTGARIPPTLPTVEHNPIVRPREAVGNTSAVSILTVTICMEMKNLPISEKITISS